MFRPSSGDPSSTVAPFGALPGMVLEGVSVGRTGVVQDGTSLRITRANKYVCSGPGGNASDTR